MTFQILDSITAVAVEPIRDFFDDLRASLIGAWEIGPYAITINEISACVL